MRYPALLFVVAGLAIAQEPITPKETIHLFNGKDLTNFYTWLSDAGYQDPDKVYSVAEYLDGGPAIRISGQHWGSLTTRSAYANYRLVVEFRWGLLTWANRKTGVRDSGVLVHGQGRDGASQANFKGPWMRSVECQVGEGIVGDFISVGGFDESGQRVVPQLTVKTRKIGRELFYDPSGPPTQATRVAWQGRDPDWKDELGFRGRNDVESPLGQWTRIEVVCEGPNITLSVNGKVVNVATQTSLSSGKILLQSEGAETYYRRIDLEPLTR
jgi:Domain of Unknown Function (DUF1080)